MMDTESARRTRRYRELVDHLAESMGHVYGWKSAVAGMLDVHPSYISKIAADPPGIAVVGEDIAERACRALSIRPEFFTEPAVASVAEYIGGSATPVRHARSVTGDMSPELHAMHALEQLTDDERTRVLAWAALRWPKVVKEEAQ